MSSTSSVNKYSLCSRTHPISPERFPFDITTTKKQPHFCNCFILSEKRDSSPRCAWAISRELYLHLQPLEGASWDRFVRDFILHNKKSSPLDCFSSLSGKREFNLCSPIILSAKIGIGENFISRLFENYFRVDTHLEDAGNSGLFSNFPNA